MTTDSNEHPALVITMAVAPRGDIRWTISETTSPLQPAGALWEAGWAPADDVARLVAREVHVAWATFHHRLRRASELQVPDEAPNGVHRE